MTTLNPQYISSTPLQWSFWSKDGTGALGDGIVTFYEQDDHTTLKPIYQLDNSAPTGFSELNNPIQLTAIGTFADDNGNDIIPYFYPFDANGNPELYYVTVESSTGVLQFTRDDWPPNMSEAGSIVNQNEIVNYVPNGQFLLHNDNPVIAQVTTDETDAVRYIAQGGWTFEKEYMTPPDTNDVVTFIREISSSTNPSVDANPRYYCQISTAGNDPLYSRKDLCLTFPDVNKFAGNVCTFSWYGYAVSGGTPTVELVLRQYYGIGSATAVSTGNVIETSLGTVIISSSKQFYSISIMFPQEIVPPTTVSPTIDNDFLQICIRLPNSAQTVQFTDFILQPGSVVAVAFPQTPNADFITDSTIGYLPTPKADGSDLYLPLIVADTGCYYDYSRVGSILTTFATQSYMNSINAPVVAGDGSVYVSSEYSPQGVPYSRLANYYIANSAVPNTPMFGTGTNFVLVTQSTNTFTITTQGGSGSAAIGTSGFTLSSSAPAFTFTVGSVPTASTYITFTTIVPVTYAVWYQLNGSAAPTGTGASVLIPVVIDGLTTTQIAVATQLAINSYQFATPNLVGMFLRQFDSTGAVDPSYNARTIAALGLTGAYLGGIEAQAFLNHTHTNNFTAEVNGSHNTSGGNDPIMNGNTIDVTASGTVTISGSVGTSSTGGNETRPVNTAVNFWIYL